jgi:hypothetical protein
VHTPFLIALLAVAAATVPLGTQRDCLEIDRFLDSHARYGEAAISVMIVASFELLKRS